MSMERRLKPPKTRLWQILNFFVAKSTYQIPTLLPEERAFLIRKKETAVFPRGRISVSDNNSNNNSLGFDIDLKMSLNTPKASDLLFSV